MSREAVGILKAFDAGTYYASVQLRGSALTYLSSIPVSRAIPAVEMTVGRSVSITFFSPTDVSDAVVTAVYG